MAHKLTLFLLRISLGWYMFYAGITKVIDPAWSAEGYLKGAKLLPGFYMWLTSPGIMPVVNFINEWGLTLLGVSLILGIFIKYSAPLGVLLMLLYYIPLGIIHPDAHSLIVDQHVVFGLLMIYFTLVGAGKVWGLDGRIGKLKNPWLSQKGE
ncbi:DoxX family protein [Candidatus Parcubacteria bacterium]|nr:DoxX family protein [Candidatus Parcubacteria bacterium]